MKCIPVIGIILALTPFVEVESLKQRSRNKVLGEAFSNISQALATRKDSLVTVVECCVFNTKTNATSSEILKNMEGIPQIIV